MSRRNRNAQRKDLDINTRMLLAEGDMDDHDVVLDELREELKRFRGVMLGMLVSLATAGILLAINLAIGALGGSA